MGYEEQIRRERPGMSKSFAKLADFLLDNYVEASFMTASELAQVLNLDAATVVRFSQQLGYGGYPRLQKEIRQKVRTDLLIRPIQAEDSDSVPGIIERTMREMLRGLEQVRMSLNSKAIAELVDVIGESRRIVILPEAPAQPAAYNLVYFLEQGGFSAFIARPGVADLARAVHTASSNDLLFALDISGLSPYIAITLQEARLKSIPTAAIVGTGSIPSARAAQVILEAQAQDALGTGIVAIDAIVYTLAEVLRWRYASRFAGSEQAISEITRRILLNA